MRRLIIVIENDFVTRGLLHHRLSAMGFDAVAARSGQDGLTLITSLAAIECEIHGILLNLELPRLDGIAVLQKLQEGFAGIPVIMMASMSSAPRLEEALRHGARDTVIKPLNPVVLQEKCLRHFTPASN